MPPELAVQEDNFDAAFAQFGADTTPVGSTVPDKVPPADEPPADEPPADEPPADEPPADEPPADEPPADEPPADEPPVDEPPAPKASDTDLLERLAALMDKPRTKEEPPAPVEPEPEMYTADEQTFLSEYEKDWPDVAKAESLKRRAEYRDLVNHVFSEVAKELTPLAQNMRALLERTQLSDIHAQVEDYDDVRDKVIDWVDTQPKYLQSAYKHVIQQGTPDEIADLVTRYKAEVAPAVPTVKPPKKESELPPATKQAVASLAPVSSKRSTIVQATDPNDFEGAFAEAAKQGT